MRRLLFPGLALLLTTAAQARTEMLPPPPPPEGAALTEAIRVADAKLFALFFTGCDPARLRTMVSDTLEFYHDKAGVTARSGKEFVDQYAQSCEAKKAADAWRSRRELVADSLRVDPVPGYGAMEVGEHLFYERQGDGPERLAGKAGFAMVWQWANGTWKLHRVLSFAHRPAE